MHNTLNTNSLNNSKITEDEIQKMPIQDVITKLIPLCSNVYHFENLDLKYKTELAEEIRKYHHFLQDTSNGNSLSEEDQQTIRHIFYKLGNIAIKKGYIVPSIELIQERDPTLKPSEDMKSLIDYLMEMPKEKRGEIWNNIYFDNRNESKEIDKFIAFR